MHSSSPTLQELLEHADWLRALACRLAGPEAADDLVQETWLAAAGRPPSPSISPRKWLAAVLRRKWIDQRRSSSIRETNHAEPIEVESLPAADTLLERVEIERKLVRLILELEEPARTAIILHYRENQPVTAIAKQLKRSEGWTRKRLEQGLERLRMGLDANGGGRAAWASLFYSSAAQPVPALTATASLSPLTSVLFLMKAKPVIASLAGLAALLLFRTIATTTPADLQPNEELAQASPIVLPSQERAELLSASRSIVPSEQREPLATTDQPTSSARHSIQLLHSDGRPANHLKTAFAPASPAGSAPSVSDLLIETTDDHGRVLVPESFTNGTWFVMRPAAPRASFTLQAESYPKQLSLPRGQVLSGQVWVDGKLAHSPVSIRLDIDTKNTQFSAWHGALRRAFKVGSKIETTSIGDGRFFFEGLPANGSGKLIPSEAYVVEGSSASTDFSFVQLFEWQNEVNLRLESKLRIHGRVLGADGEILPHARVQLFQEEINLKRKGTIHANAEGQFEYFFRRNLVESLELSPTPNEDQIQRGHRASYHFQVTGLDSELDVGDLSLGKSAACNLRIVDNQSKPIGGAHAYLNGLQVGTTDSQGKLHLPTWPADGDSELNLFRRGFQPTTVRPAIGETEQTFEMLASGHLLIRVVDAANQPLARRPLFLGFEGRLFSKTLDELTALQYMSAEAPDSITYTEDDSRVPMVTDALGQLELTGVLPGASAWIEVRDAWSHQQTSTPNNSIRSGRVEPMEIRDLHESAQSSLPFVFPEPGQSLVLTLRHNSTGFPFEVKAEDSAGAPLQGVHVRFGPFRGLTSAQGRYRVEGLELERKIDIKVSKVGFVSKTLPHQTIGRGSRQLVIQLQASRSVRVRVQDHFGVAIPAEIWASLRDSEQSIARAKRSASTETDSDDPVLTGLPSNLELYIHAKIGPRTFQIEHNSNDPLTQLELPTPGSLKVHWELTSEAQELIERMRVLIEISEPMKSRVTPVTQRVQRHPNDFFQYSTLLPGTYRVRLIQTGSQATPLSDQREVVIKSGQRAEVHLGQAGPDRNP